MEPDIHWSAMSGHISTFVVNGGQYAKIFWTEQFKEGMQSVLDSIQTKHAINLERIPRFDELEGHGPKRAHSVEEYFDDLSMHLMYEIYHRDFDLFKYDSTTWGTNSRSVKSTLMKSTQNLVTDPVSLS